MPVGQRIQQLWRALLLPGCPPGQPTSDWCGPPPRHTVGHATKAGETCTVCSTPLERAEPPDAKAGSQAVWCCPRCGSRYHEPVDRSPDRDATTP
jgi:hypothetical protein